MRVSYKVIIFILGLFLVVDFTVWFYLISRGHPNDLIVSVLDVGQGDGIFMKISHNTPFRDVDIMIDGGKGGLVLNELEEVLGFYDRYIDLLVITHPHLDHFGGFIDVLNFYKVGGVIYNGREGTSAAWKKLKNIIEEKGIPLIALHERDSIHYEKSVFDILAPHKHFLRGKDVNDSSLVMNFHDPRLTMLFTGDITERVESRLLSIASSSLHATILKVAHHGSLRSSISSFINAVNPRFAIISVGKNSYGHPGNAVIEQLLMRNIDVLRTDLNGRITIRTDKKNNVRIYKER